MRSNRFALWKKCRHLVQIHLGGVKDDHHEGVNVAEKLNHSVHVATRAEVLRQGKQDL
jgi:hypothetical protein